MSDGRGRATRWFHAAALACAVALPACADRWLEAPEGPGPEGCAADTWYDPISGRCVRALCAADHECPGELRCDLVEGLCVDPEPNEEIPGEGGGECRDGTRRCAANGTRQRCNAGKWVAYPCPGNTACEGGTCQPCPFGERRCHADRDATVEVCNADGTWTSIACTAPGATCEAGQCTICEPGERQCGGTAVLACSADGTDWISTPCAEGERCVDGDDGAICVENVCQPREQSCIEGEPSMRRICAADGSRLVESPCPPGTTCRGNGVCLNSCDVAANDRLGVGCEYWFTQLPTGGDVLATGKHPSLVVVNAEAQPVAIHLLASHREEPIVEGIVLPGRGAIEVQLPVVQRTGTSIRDGAFRLLSTGPVSARLVARIHGGTLEGCACLASECAPDDPCIVPGGDGAGATLLPLHLLVDEEGEGSNYVAWSPRHQVAPTDRPGLIAIVATRDDTEVHVDFSTATAPGSGPGALPAFAPGERGTFTLDAGEVLQIATAAAGNRRTVVAGGFARTEYVDAHFAGTVVRSSAPVAVFAGADGHRLPLDGGTDPVLEQLPHRRDWGRTYVGVVGDASDWFEIVAADQSVRVAFTSDMRDENESDINLLLLGPRQVKRLRAATDFRLTADGPVLLVRLGSGGSGGGASALLPQPATAWRSRHHLRASTTGAEIRIVAPKVDADGEPTEVFVADVPIVAWTKVGNTMQSARVPLCEGKGSVCVPTGEYLVHASAPVLVEVAERDGWGIAFSGDRGPDPLDPPAP